MERSSSSLTAFEPWNSSVNPLYRSFDRRSRLEDFRGGSFDNLAMVRCGEKGRESVGSRPTSKKVERTMSAGLGVQIVRIHKGETI